MKGCANYFFSKCLGVNHGSNNIWVDGDPIKSVNLRVVLIDKIVATNGQIVKMNLEMKIRGLISEALSMQVEIIVYFKKIYFNVEPYEV